jgi:hypothetical protein
MKGIKTKEQKKINGKGSTNKQVAKVNKGKKKVLKLRKRDNSIELAKEVLLEGYNSQKAIEKVIEYRQQNNLSLLPSTIEKIVHSAHMLIAEEFGKDKLHVTSLHLERYNREIIAILEMENPFEKVKEKELEILNLAANQNISPEEISELVNKMIAQVFGENVDHEELARLKSDLTNKYFTALSTMFAKERLLQMHTKGFQLHVINRLNLDVKEEKKQYDLSKLTFEQKVDFLNLILECKKNEFEAGSVILRESKDEPEIIDISHEVIEEVPNIEKIKHEVKHVVNESEEKRGLFDVNQKLAQAFRVKAQQEYENAGSKINGSEQNET